MLVVLLKLGEKLANADVPKASNDEDNSYLNFAKLATFLTSVDFTCLRAIRDVLSS